MKIISVIPGTSEFFSITFSNPLPIEIIKNVCGKTPIKVDQKKLETLTLKMQVINFED